ncbi:Proteasome assembly chaperone 2 [Galemys pyrenaicus]|uniref:Proteasome assembly chaperone 2 n=1 Tax=Galemys pyrenaicus TaxID=202257 RepID=A0A8J5ZQA3_GALPY|nr:Proteasome assembly chaperone 2 [Galemys pyrenaicus]
MVGNNPYATAEENSTELSINAEVYSLPSKKLIALQLRSIFIKKVNFMIVSSTPFRYLLTPSIQKSVQNKIQSLNWEEMEKSPCIPEIDDSEFCIRIPGGGITKTLYDESCSKEIPVAVLLKFVSEGDNIPDALGLVEYLNEWLHIIKPCDYFVLRLQNDDPTASALHWKMPSSWRLLFGSGLPPALF